MPATENIVNIESDRKVELESNSKMVTKTSEPEVKVSSEKQTTFSLYKLAFVCVASWGNRISSHHVSYK